MSYAIHPADISDSFAEALNKEVPDLIERTLLMLIIGICAMRGKWEEVDYFSLIQRIIQNPWLPQNSDSTILSKMQGLCSKGYLAERRLPLTPYIPWWTPTQKLIDAAAVHAGLLTA